MFSRSCRRFSGRSDRPGGRRRQDPARRTPLSQRRPAWALRGDPQPGRRAVRFRDRPAEIPGADSVFSRPCGRFSGRSDRPGRPRPQELVKARAVIPSAPGLRVTGRSPTGATACKLRRSTRRKPGRGFHVFKALRPIFRANGPAVRALAPGLVKARAVTARAPGLGLTGRSPTGATACKLRRSTRRKPGRGFHVFKALRPIFRAIGPATRASAPGPVKASAVTARAPGLGLTGRSPTGATACKLRRSTRRKPGRGFHVFKALRPIFRAIGRSQLPRSPPSARAPSTMLRMVPLPRAVKRHPEGDRRRHRKGYHRKKGMIRVFRLAGRRSRPERRKTRAAANEGHASRSWSSMAGLIRPLRRFSRSR